MVTVDVEKQASLSMTQATEPLPLQALRAQTLWEARVFGSLCVSPYVLATPWGDLDLQHLAAAGELVNVTLRSADWAGQVAAFLAHFVARCCKTQVVSRADFYVYAAPAHAGACRAS